MPHRLDSRWSWLVSFCATFCQTVNMGTLRTFGVVFPVLIDHFDSSRERTGELYAIVLTNLWTEPDVFKHRVISFVNLCSTNKTYPVSLHYEINIFKNKLHAVFHSLCHPTWLPCKSSIEAKSLSVESNKNFPHRHDWRE